jgi:excisionase family DNA binding protein
MLSAQEVAQFLGVPITTLYQWRTKGTAPRAIKVGRHIRFLEADLLAWCERHADQPSGGAA